MAAQKDLEDQTRQLLQEKDIELNMLKTTIANVATTKIRMVKGKTVEVPPTPSKGAIF